VAIDKTCGGSQPSGKDIKATLGRVDAKALEVNFPADI